MQIRFFFFAVQCHKNDIKIFVLKLRLTLSFLLDLEDQFIKNIVILWHF